MTDLDKLEDVAVWLGSDGTTIKPPGISWSEAAATVREAIAELTGYREDEDNDYDDLDDDDFDEDEGENDG